MELTQGTHYELLEGRDVVDGTQNRYGIVWADRDSDNCPRCGQHVGREVDDCPVQLNLGAGQGGAIVEYSQQHGCGEWLAVTWAEVKAAGLLPTDDEIESAAAALR